MKSVLRVTIVSFVVSVMAMCAFSQLALADTPREMHVSCTAPNPDHQKGLHRPKGDSNHWEFKIVLDGNAHFVKDQGPFWEFEGIDGNDPDWGMITGGKTGDSSMEWWAPTKTDKFKVRVYGQISCGNGGDGKPIDFSAGWEGEVCPGVQKIQYNDPSNGYVDVTDTLYVLKGTKVTFKAIPDEPEGSFCEGEPHWDGSAGATGTGESKEVTFDTISTSLTDYKTVSVSEGNSNTEKTVNVVVYDLTPKLILDDPFDGRSETRLGIGETAKLSYDVEPTDIGGLVLQYTKQSGDATLFANQFTAGDSDSDVTLRITLASGPSKGEYRELSRTVVTPSAYMIQEPGSGVEHTNGIAGLAFHAWVYLTPKDVSFKKLQVREGTGTSIVTADINGANTQGAGYFAAHQLGGVHHGEGAWQPVISNSIITGSRVGLFDTVGLNNLPAPYASANTIDAFAWPIQWWYKNNGVAHELALFTHYVTIDDAGTVTISKGGAGPVTKAVGAATTNIHPPGYTEP